MAAICSGVKAEMEDIGFAMAATSSGVYTVIASSLFSSKISSNSFGCSSEISSETSSSIA